MAALQAERGYGLSCGRLGRGTRVSVFHVKLTESALRAFESYQACKVRAAGAGRRARPRWRREAGRHEAPDGDPRAAPAGLAPAPLGWGGVGGRGGLLVEWGGPVLPLRDVGWGADPVTHRGGDVWGGVGRCGALPGERPRRCVWGGRVCVPVLLPA